MKFICISNKRNISDSWTLTQWSLFIFFRVKIKDLSRWHAIMQTVVQTVLCWHFKNTSTLYKETKTRVFEFLSWGISFCLLFRVVGSVVMVYSLSIWRKIMFSLPIVFLDEHILLQRHSTHLLKPHYQPFVCSSDTRRHFNPQAKLMTPSCQRPVADWTDHPRRQAHTHAQRLLFFACIDSV